MREEDLLILEKILGNESLIQENEPKSILIVGNDKTVDQILSVRQALGKDVSCDVSNYNFETTKWTGKKYDLLIALNVLHGVKDIDSWFKNTESAAKLLVVQGLINARRGVDSDTDPDSGDYTRFSFVNARGPEGSYELEMNDNIKVSETVFYDGPNCRKFFSFITFPQKTLLKKVKNPNV